MIMLQIYDKFSELPNFRAAKAKKFALFQLKPASIRAGTLISWSPRPNILERSVETEFYSFMGTTS